jgi:peptidoglycan/LPS O-acetylase OafA/YrhL
MRANTTSSGLTYRPDIDGLRAIAVLLVLVFHFKLVSMAAAGFMGVDIFFVISGFLITGILKRELDAKTLSFRTFYLSRIRRLAPALTATLLLVFLFAAVNVFAGELLELSRQALASQLYVANFYFWGSVNYFGLQHENVFLLHMWSLAVEEQFYFLYPITLFLVDRYFKNYFWAFVAAGGLLSFALNIGTVAQRPEAVFYLLPARAWELVLGGTVNQLTGIWKVSRGTDEALGAVGLILIVCAVTFYSKETVFPGAYALLPVVGSACLLLAGHQNATTVSRFLCTDIATYVGRISYPLYLVHWPINVFGAGFFGRDYSLSYRVAGFCGSFALAALLTHGIEEPIRRRHWLRSNRQLLVAYLAALAVSFLTYTLVQANRGFPKRFPAEVSRLAAYDTDHTSVAMNQCEFPGKGATTERDFCYLGAQGDSAKWLVYGDSHAWAAYAAFDEWLRRKHERGLFIFRNSCPPILDVNVFGDHGECVAMNRAVFDFLGDHPSVGSVILVSAWRQAVEAKLSTSPTAYLSEKASVELFESQFDRTIKKLRDSGKRIYIWEPLPGATQSVPKALARSALEHRPVDIEISRRDYFEFFDFFFSALERNGRDIHVRIRTSDALCASGKCSVVIANTPAYFDDGHITQSPFRFWVSVLDRAERDSARDH